MKHVILAFILFFSTPVIADEVLSPLTIATKAGNTHLFHVELALTKEQQQHGLMFREQLPENHGMLFIYPYAQTLSMWMKNTLIPLDMLFIKADGTIANIASHTIPFSLETIPSATPAIAVLEINAGLSEKLGIQAGDTVLHSRLPNGLSH